MIITLLVQLLFLSFYSKLVLRLRSTVAGANTLIGNLGWLIGISLGLVVPLQYYALALGFPSVLFLLVCWVLVESPIWLVRRERLGEAVKEREM